MLKPGPARAIDQVAMQADAWQKFSPATPCRLGRPRPQDLTHLHDKLSDILKILEEASGHVQRAAGRPEALLPQESPGVPERIMPIMPLG